MAELATIARPYADALFQLSSADLGATQVWLDGLAQIASDASLLQLAGNPKVGADQVFDLMSQAMDKGFPKAGQNFLRTVLDNGRLAVLPEIAQQFRVLANRASGTADAIVQSALPLDDAALKKLVTALEKRFGRKLQASLEVVPSLIGGVRVSVGDEVLDTSIKAQLEQMQAVLTA